MEIPEILKACKTVAVVGLSKDKEKDSHKVALYLKANGYRIVPVNPTAYEILDEKCYSSLSDVWEEIDLVCVFRPPEEAEGIVREAIAKKAKVVWMQLGIKNDRAAEIAGEAGIDVVMDKCIMIEHKRYQELTLIEKSRTVVVPILTEQEGMPDFLERLKSCTKLVMVFVVDKNFLNHVPTAFSGSRITIAQEVMDGIKKNMPQNIMIKDFVEWGDWYDKLEGIARLENADEIVMKHSKMSDEFSSRLREKGLRVTVV